MSEQFLKMIMSRRVIRTMSDQPVERSQLEKIVDAARWGRLPEISAQTALSSSRIRKRCG